MDLLCNIVLKHLPGTFDASSSLQCASPFFCPAQIAYPELQVSSEVSQASEVQHDGKRAKEAEKRGLICLEGWVCYS